MKYFFYLLLPFSLCFSLNEYTWNHDGDANWNNGANWNDSGNFPNDANAKAIFPNILSGPTNVTLGQNITVAAIDFNSNLPYTIIVASPQSLTFDTNSGNAAVHLLATNNMSARIDTPVILNKDLDITVDSTATADCSINGVISGNGKLTKNGPGFLTLSGSTNNTFTGGTDVRGGTLFLSKTGAKALRGTINVLSGATLQLNNSDQIDHAAIVNVDGNTEFNLNGFACTVAEANLTNFGHISGTGSLITTKIGLGDNSTIDSPINCQNEDATIETNGTSGISSQISNVGILTKSGVGTLTFSGSDDNSMEGVNIDDGKVICNKSVGVAALSGQAVVGINTSKSPVLSFQQNDQLDHNATLVLAQPGTIQTNGTTQQVANLVHQGGNFDPSSVGEFVVSNEVAFEQSALSHNLKTAFYIITDGVSLAVSATGFRVDSGIGAQMKGVVDMGTAQRVLSIANTSSLSFENNVTSSGFSVRDGGALKLLALKTLTSSAPVTIENGTFVANGNVILAAGMEIQSLGALRGNGSINGNLTVRGTLAPGESIGTLNIVGNLTLTGSSTTEIEISPSAADLVNVSGNLTIQPGAKVSVIPESGTYPSNYRQTIFTAGAPIIGTFASLNTSRVILDYSNPNQIDLLLVKTIYSNLVKGGNPGVVAKTLDLIDPQYGSDLDNVIDQVQTNNPSALRSFFNQLHPALYKGLIDIQEKNSVCFANGIYAHTTTYFATKEERELTPQRKKDTLWIDGLGDFANQDHHKENVGFRGYTGGVLLGWDRQWTKNFIAGATLGFTFSDMKWQHKRGNGDVTTGYGALYQACFNDVCFLETSIYGGYSTYKGKRNIFTNPVFRTAKYSDHGYEVGAQLKHGYFIHTSSLDINPYLSLDYIYLIQNKFSETGALSLNLDILRSKASFLRSELGIDLTHCFVCKDCRVIPNWKLAVSDDARFSGEKYKARFQNTTPIFVTKGIHPNRVQFAYGMGINILSNDNMSFLIRYDGEGSKHYWNHNLNIGLSKDF